MFSEDKQIREVQEKTLIIMKELDALCRKYGIQYSLHGGTLLGAVREHGFIPWDDDLDVSMTRSEYMKLCECFQRDGLMDQLSSVCGIDRFRDLEISDGAWIDFFIYDSISANPKLQ